MFPVTDGQIARMARQDRKTFEPGELLFDEGASNVPIHVVLEGEIEVVRAARRSASTIAASSTGEISTLYLRPAGARAGPRARRRCRPSSSSAISCAKWCRPTASSAKC